jgi:hypothetical protein
MLRKLFYTGISKETWILTKMLYQDLHSKVKWEGKISSPFYEQQGVHIKIRYYLEILLLPRLTID